MFTHAQVVMYSLWNAKYIILRYVLMITLLANKNIFNNGILAFLVLLFSVV